MKVTVTCETCRGHFNLDHWAIDVIDDEWNCPECEEGWRAVDLRAWRVGEDARMAALGSLGLEFRRRRRGGRQKEREA